MFRSFVKDRSVNRPYPHMTTFNEFLAAFKLTTVGMAVLLFFCSCAPSMHYPKPEELTGIYDNPDTSRHEVLSLLSIIPFTQGNWTSLYLHLFRDKDGKQVRSTGEWFIDLSKGRGPDYDFGYPPNQYRITLINWLPYAGDSLLPYTSPDVYYSHRSQLYGFAHYESANSKVLILDSFYREPGLRFVHRHR
ncbi:MAG: hypothetical protein Q8916_00825 [Bacteroidota bacterium]|nr:hypothetical protein [Bacteroidota bacterium]MDP4228929.1 hypothetical protein [Bacteroidota bacterium]MDP4236705.1 hypothetical protein [Bacteroidota bacterium]